MKNKIVTGMRQAVEFKNNNFNTVPVDWVPPGVVKNVVDDNNKVNNKPKN